MKIIVSLLAFTLCCCSSNIHNKESSVNDDFNAIIDVVDDEVLKNNYVKVLQDDCIEIVKTKNYFNQAFDQECILFLRCYQTVGAAPTYILFYHDLNSKYFSVDYVEDHPSEVFNKIGSSSIIIINIPQIAISKELMNFIADECGSRKLFTIKTNPHGMSIFRTDMLVGYNKGSNFYVNYYCDEWSILTPNKSDSFLRSLDNFKILLKKIDQVLLKNNIPISIVYMYNFDFSVIGEEKKLEYMKYHINRGHLRMINLTANY